ncbi:MAG: DUF4097 domain-containing protein [Gemmatimonadales bacterium]
MRIPVVLLAATVIPLLGAAPAAAQLSCRDTERSSRWGERFCTMETRTLRAGGTIKVLASPNGGVTVIGWDRNEIELRAKITASARSDDRAEEIGRGVRIQTSGTEIEAEGPRTGDREGWSVSYELRVPRRSDLWVRSNNGGISVEDVSGEMDLATTNGGLSLANLGGDVRAETTNGGVDVALGGRRWNGRGLTARTRNGGVDLVVPDDYGAELEVATRNGGLDFDFPIRVRGRLNRQVTTTLGDGGPPISVSTTNGGVTVRRQ